MPIMGICPNPECGADLVIPRRVGARIICDECDMEWEVEDYDPVELISVDGDDWGDEAEDEDDDAALPLPLHSGGTALASARAVVNVATQTQWECQECGMIQMGLRAPRKCPSCGADSDQFAMVVADDLDPLDEDMEDAIVTLDENE